MDLRLKLCVLVVMLVLSPAVRLGAEPRAESPALPEDAGFDIEALAVRAEAVLAFVRAHHIDPPSEGEMWLAGIQGLGQAVLNWQDPQVRAQFRALQAQATQLNTAEERREFLTKIWSDHIAPKISGAKVSRIDLLRDFIRGMLPEGADLVPASEYKIEERVRGNRYSGTGIAIDSQDPSGFPRIAAVIPGGPMERAGGQKNDLIVNIDGRDTHGWMISQIRDVLSGEEGTNVTVELKQGVNTAGRTIVLTRGTIVFPTLHGMNRSSDNYRVQPNSPIRYVAIGNINGSTVHDLRRLESTFRSEGARAVILDLRMAMGHDLHTALLLADALLDGGMIGRLRTRSRVQEFQADRDRLFRDMPLAILVGENTGSGAEWVAAALQDHDAAVIVGGPTAGSTLVKTFMRFPGTSEILELATGKFERPKGSLEQPRRSDNDSRAGSVIPNLIAENNNSQKIKVVDRNRKVVPGAVSKPDELKGIDPDAALTAAVGELTRRIDAAASEIGRN